MTAQARSRWFALVRSRATFALGTGDRLKVTGKLSTRDARTVKAEAAWIVAMLKRHRRQVQRVTVPAEPVCLAPEHWEACGITVVRGTPSHRFGDANAERILSGEIPLAQAIADEQRQRRTLNEMTRNRIR